LPKVLAVRGSDDFARNADGQVRKRRK